jgi:hypothetical protein
VIVEVDVNLCKFNGFDGDIFYIYYPGCFENFIFHGNGEFFQGAVDWSSFSNYMIKFFEFRGVIV